MRTVIVGLGAIGGVVAGRLIQHGHEVIALARGAQLNAVRRGGLTVRDASGEVRVVVEAVDNPAEIDWRCDDIILLCVKSHQTHAAVWSLAEHAPFGTPVVCVQNGVRNEEIALRFFPRAYGAVVGCPATFLEPGVVTAHSAPVSGLIDFGRYPFGTDEVADSLAERFAGSQFDSHAVGDIARWKWRKLLTNLSNAVEAVCGSRARSGEVTEAVRAEGRAVLNAAGIDAASAEEDVARRADLLSVGAAGASPRSGGSTWQSLARGADGIETDYLNGEVVALGRIHGIATPVNELLQRLVRVLSCAGCPPLSLPEGDILRLASGQEVAAHDDWPSWLIGRLGAGY